MAAIRVSQKKKNIFQYKLRNMSGHLIIDDVLVTNTPYRFYTRLIG